MSEYWVSKKKYFCKYCEIYIADDAPSRQHHENGLRHKGNLERFIRGIYKAGEKQKKDKEEEKREMKRVEQAAAAAFAQDVGAGIAKAAGSVASSSTTAKKPPPKPSNPYANYSTAASLGFTDPDADRLAEEMKIRQTQGVAGQWEMVASTVQESEVSSSSSFAQQSDSTSPTPADAEVGVKREAEGPPAEEDIRAFKLRKKQLTTGLGEIYDPGLIPIKVKKKEEPQDAPLPGSSLTTDTKPDPQTVGPSTSKPKWTTQPDQDSNSDGVVTTRVEEDPKTTTSNQSSKWARAKWSEPIPDIPPIDRTSMLGPRPHEQIPEDSKTEVNLEVPEVKVEDDKNLALPNDDAEMGSIKFRKRRAPANTGRGRREI